MSKRLPYGWHREKNFNPFYRDSRRAHKTVKLSDGQFFRFEIEITDYDSPGVRETLIQPCIVVHKGRYKYPDAHDKEGEAVGPGGLEVLPLGLELHRQSEEVGLALAGTDRVVYEVEGATEKLFRIYKRYMKARGYTDKTDEDGYDYETVYKVLRDSTTSS